MRALALTALVLGSLVFSVGGVAVTGRADDQGQTMAPAASDPRPKTVKEECTPPKRFEVRANVSKVDSSDTVVLNTRGYNYPSPGEIRPQPPSRNETGSKK